MDQEGRSFGRSHRCRAASRYGRRAVVPPGPMLAAHRQYSGDHNRSSTGRGPRYGPAVSRTVTLVLVDADGRPLGALPPYDVPEPWWQEVGSIVDGARHRHGVDVAVLRLLTGERPEPPGGHVTYLGQATE